MSRDLLIMRHAKSDWGTANTADFDRCLSKRGQQDAPRMGRWIKTQNLKPDYIVSSPAIRAMETVSLVCEALDIPEREINWDQRIYGASLNNLLTVLEEQPHSVSSMLLVGHNPGMDELICYLWGDNVQLPPNGNLVPTATLVHLSLPDDWATLKYGCGQFHTIIRPKEIKALE